MTDEQCRLCAEEAHYGDHELVKALDLYVRLARKDDFEALVEIINIGEECNICLWDRLQAVVDERISSGQVKDVIGDDIREKICVMSSSDDFEVAVRALLAYAKQFECLEGCFEDFRLTLEECCG